MPVDTDKFKYCVKIPYAFADGTINDWNEHGAKAMELFGLPGDKFRITLLPENLEFWFADESDAVFFELSCG